MNPIWKTSSHGSRLAIYAHQEDIYPDACSASNDIITDEYYIELMHSHCDAMKYMTIVMGDNNFGLYIEKKDITNLLAGVKTPMVLVASNYVIFPYMFAINRTMYGARDHRLIQEDHGVSVHFE